MRALPSEHADFRAGVAGKPSSASWNIRWGYMPRVAVDCWRAEACKLILAGEERIRFGHINAKQKK